MPTDNQNTAPTAKPIAPIINLPANAAMLTFPAKADRTLAKINAIIRDQRKANHPAASEDFTARWNDRVDAALALPIATVTEAEAMLRLALAVEGEAPDELFLAALQSVSRVLAAIVKDGGQ